jgi:hypothetical protein
MRRRVLFALLLTGLGALGTLVPGCALARDTTELISKGWSKAELVKILDDFESMYHGRLGVGFHYLVTPLTPDQFDIHFPAGIAHPFFAYLVNYVQYPKGFDLTGRQVAVLGRVTLTAAYPIPSSDYAGMRARIYVPADDQEHDLVYVAVGQEFFRQQFTYDLWDRKTDGRVPVAVKALW